MTVGIVVAAFHGITHAALAFASAPARWCPREHRRTVRRSGQSGIQIAEELHRAGRNVFLFVGKCGRLPRRSGGRDIAEWMLRGIDRGAEVGLPPRTVTDLPNPRARFAPNPQLSGRDGGHAVWARQLGACGVSLFGHLESGAGTRLRFASDLLENLSAADQFAAKFLRDVDRVRVPVFDAEGYPIQERGITEFAGLHFIGLPWLYRQTSSLLGGVGHDAAYLADHVAARATADAR